MQELQEAEAKAEAEALAASQKREQTGRRETADEGRGLEGEASFTEENLQSAVGTPPFPPSSQPSLNLPSQQGE